MATMNLNVVDAPSDLPAMDVYVSGDIGGGDATVADGSVTTAKLAANAVTAAKLAANAVTNEKIANGTIQAAKLASGVIPTPPANATTAVAGLVKQAAHVDETSGTVQQVVQALVAAGIMAAS